MQRYFTDNLNNEIFTLSLDDTYHIKKVMRMKIGENIEIVHNTNTYLAEIIQIDNIVKAKILEEIKDFNELSYKIILVQSLVKEQKMDIILQKNTELGVCEFIPYFADNSIIKIKDNDSKKINRWQKIVKEASEQSKRNIIPKVSDIISISELVKIDADLKLFCSVNEKSVCINNVLSNINKNDKILVVIGPEGGFTKKEEETFIDNGFISISLGHSVLRTETAGIFVSSCIRYKNMG